MGILAAIKKRIAKWKEEKKKEAVLRELYGEDYERLKRLVKAGVISEKELFEIGKKQIRKKLPKLVRTRTPRRKKGYDWAKRMEKMFSVDFDVAGGLYGGKRKKR